MLKNVTIVSKILIGFGILFSLLLGVSVFSFYGIGNSKESFNQYRDLAKDSVLAGRLQANMLLVRFHTNRFLKSGSAVDVRKYKMREKLMLQFIDEATLMIKKPERAEKVTLIRELVDSYIESFNKVVAYKKKRDQIIYRSLDPNGLAMRKAMTDIIESAYNDGDLTAAYHAGRIQEHLLLARLYATKFLDTNKIDTVQRFEDEIGEEINSTVSIMTQELQDPGRVALFSKFKEKRELYMKDLSILVDIILDRNRIIKEGLDRVGPVIADAAEKIKLSVKTDQDILGPKVKKLNEEIIERIIYICIASLLVAVILVFLIIRAIRTPIKELVDTVNEFGEGNLDTRIVIQSDDEIGIISNAFNSMADQVTLTSSMQTDLNWIATSRVNFEEGIRGIQQIEALADTSLNFLVTTLKAQVGAIYVLDNNHFRFISGYACKKEEIEDEVFELGEGLIGQVAKEDKMICLTDVPEDYVSLSITSSIGKTRPKNIVAVPVSYLNRVLCVVEIAKLDTFSEQETTLLKQIRTGFGIALNSVFANIKLEKLLQESRTLSKQLEHDQNILTIRSQELDRSNRELDEFAHTASHDLKEPLRGIYNYSTFLIEDYGDKLDEEGRHKLETLKSLCQHLDELISNLLFYSRVGRTKSGFCDVDINKNIEEVIETLKIMINEQGVDIRIPETLPVCFCDKARIKDIFMNLITNAIKYNDKTEKKVEIGFSKDKIGNVETFYVRDNGLGIREKHIESIFKIFKRLHGKDKYGGGTGAGLAIARKIVENHGGKIWAESTFGQGTTFYFTLGRSVNDGS
ncbi:MAG: HAMP domain-containing protein [Candidatus Scalindua sp.]|nr:HAMP domain-containing protein [Candidatus Scalindua sp.]